MKSPRERLLAAHAELRGAAAAPDHAIAAHLAAFEAYADLAMMQEASSELGGRRIVADANGHRQCRVRRKR